jgi:hypothetical protein
MTLGPRLALESIAEVLAALERRHLYRAEIQRREEEKRETGKLPKVIPSPYLDFLIHASTTIIPLARISV